MPIPLAKHREPVAGAGQEGRADATKGRQISNENGSDLNSTRDDIRETHNRLLLIEFAFIGLSTAFDRSAPLESIPISYNEQATHGSQSSSTIAHRIVLDSAGLCREFASIDAEKISPPSVLEPLNGPRSASVSKRLDFLKALPIKAFKPISAPRHTNSSFAP
jgi:hypothetical protein